MDNFVAIDVETANYEPTSICAVGAVKVEDGIITDRFYTLVQPEPNYYVRRFTETVHGISRRHTDTAPCFADIWPRLRKFIGDLPLAAHNKAFDEKCLIATCDCYCIPWPDYTFHCTLSAARKSIPRFECPSKSLPCVCDFFGIPFDNHHNALADAEACAKIGIIIL